MKAVQFTTTGGPEVLEVVDIPAPVAGPGQVLVRQQAIGINFIDTYHRSGLYPVKLPSRLGMEGAGVVEAVGEGVTRFKAGDLIAYASGPLGAYAELHAVVAERAVRLPEGVDAATGAAAMLKGMTAEFLLRRCYPVKAGETILVHAAAGGVGSILVQWAKHLGATVIGVVSKPQSQARALAAGCAHALVFDPQTLAADVRAITGGRMADVVYDGLGKLSFAASLDCLRPRGLMVSFGATTGAPPAVEMATLNAKGSLYITRPSLAAHTATAAEYQQRATAVLQAVEQGVIQPVIGRRYALADVAAAHADLEAGLTQGAVVLLP